MKTVQLTADQAARVDEQLTILSRGAAEIVPADGLKAKLITSITTGRPLRVKLGLDPSAPDVHIGHTVVLRKLRQFQDFGHEVQLVIGDFTGRIGDPSGRNTTRPQLNDAEVAANARTYVEQFARVMDMDKATIHFNSTWLSQLNFADVVTLAAQLTVARMLEREDFSKRYKEGQPIHVHEFFYPLMQGYDSIALKTDIELGGTDQTFNLLMGRTLQEAYGQEKQTIMTMPLLVGLDGQRKMSKSLGNYIGVAEEPNSIFGKTMSLPDELLEPYFELATNISADELNALRAGLLDGSVHPRDAKMRLANSLVSLYHGPDAAREAQERFVSVFSQRQLPTDIPHLKWTGDNPAWIVELLTQSGLTPSNSEARRKIQSGAVRINGEKVSDETMTVDLTEEIILQVGRRGFVRVSC